MVTNDETEYGFEIHITHIQRLGQHVQGFILFYNGVKDKQIVRGLATLLNTLRPRQNGCHFPDDIFQWIFLVENE